MNDTPDIVKIEKIPNVSSVMNSMHPAVQSWIKSVLGSINELQRVTIPRIMDNKHTLVMAPTGAGKTLAAFLGIISKLCTMEDNNQLENKIYVLYISPLKALNNDIHKNLELPLDSIRELNNNHITIGKRTGDTSTKERAKIARNPPHILITTPESLALMLTAPKFKEKLRFIKWVIVDEIHAIAGNKRGSLLSICLERLEYYLTEETTRIGLSATVEPPVIVAHYLVGNRKTEIGIVNMAQIRKLEVEVISPVNNLIYAPHTLIRKKHMELIEERIRNHQTSLIFTNTRHLAEKLVLDIQKSRADLGDKIAVHHGSLSKEVRLDVEERLKAGKMKAVFTSTSLEMGIDIGSIDHTVQLGSPKTVRAFTQRIGRSGHSQNLHSKGSLLVFDRDDLIECMAVAKLSTSGLVDSIRIPKAPVDVLFQMLVGMAVEKRWSIEDAYHVIIRSYPYREMSYDIFREILNSAATTTGDDNAWKYALIWVDLEINEFGRRKKARQSYMQNIGTIPDVSLVDVILETYRTKIGQIADRFAENLTPSDVFTLGGKTYVYLRTVGNKIIVRESFGQVPTIPHWVGETQTRTIEISQEISNMFEYLDNNIGDKNISRWLIKRYHISDVEVDSVLKYVNEQKSISALPTTNRLIVEEYLEPSGLKSIIVLSIFGRETNLVLAQVLAIKISSEYNISITTVSTDNGILLRLPMGIEFDYKLLFKGIRTDALLNELETKIMFSELFNNRFRHVAGRALMILKRSGTRKNSVDQQAKQARWLIKALPTDYPIVKETIREILYDTYNLQIAREILYRIEKDDMEIIFNPSDNIPSPMSHSILLNDNSDIVLMDDKKSLLLNLHQQVLGRLLPDKINPTTIFDEEEIKQAFIQKLHIKYTENDFLSVERFAEYPIITDDFMVECFKFTGVEVSRIKEIIANSELIVPWLNGYTTKHVLPYHAACFAENIWDNYDSSYNEMKERSRDLSPSLSIEYLIGYLLKYSGPITINEIISMLGKSYSEIKPVLDNLVRKHEVLVGTFYGNDTQYMLYEDRKLLDGANRSDLSLSTLTAFRLEKLRLSRGHQSSLMSINHYLEENGPVRDTIEFVARLPSFDWVELRDLLAGQLIYFGRFLGRRLVFVNKNQFRHFITITRDKNTQLDKITREVLLMIQEYPGMTAKDIMKFVVQPKNVIQASINVLEQELYISRTGWDISLTHGGFPNPQYVALPMVKITDLSYDASVKWLLHQCIRWYGPLTLQDLLRITRLPYNVVEASIVDIPVITRELFNYNYYGLTDHFRKLEKGVIFTDDVFILSPLDPYFYMISGSFRREQLPRHTRLMVVQRGKTVARIEIAIPDKDILQVLNIQISVKNMHDFDLIEEIGRQLLRIAGRAYSTQAVVIEEINFKAANHIQNKSIVLALKRVNYILKTDYLITGTKSSGDFHYSDILETRLINLNQLKNVRYSTVEELFENHDSINIHEGLNLLDLSANKAKLLISRAIREGNIHHRNGILYHPVVWKVSDEKNLELLDIFLKKQKPLTMNELIGISGIDKITIEKYMLSAIKTGLIENISPFSKTAEYRLNNVLNLNRRERVIQILMRIIRRLGPMTFGQIRSEIKQFLDVSRIEVLLILADLLKKSDIYSHSAYLYDKIQLIYFLPTQSDILMDVNRKHKLVKWAMYSVNEALFENLNSKTTHLLTYMGDGCAELQIKMEIDNIIVENIKFYDIPDIGDKVTEIINKIEEYFFKKGYQQITIRKIQSSYPKFWIQN